MLDLLNVTQSSPSLWFYIVPSLEKICQAVVARNDQANLQPTLDKVDGGASLTILWLIVVKRVKRCYFQIFLKTKSKNFSENKNTKEETIKRHITGDLTDSDSDFNNETNIIKVDLVLTWDKLRLAKYDNDTIFQNHLKNY